MERIPPRIARRFWKKVRRAQLVPEVPGQKFLKPCNIWQGARDQDGYGVFKAFPGCMGLKSGIVRVHRLAYWMAKGPFPRKAEIHHRCENPPCIEEEHLILLGPVEHAEESNEKRWGRTLSEAEEAEILAELEDT